MKALLEFMLRHPLVVLALFIAITAGVGWQARHFEIDASADTLLTPDNELYIQTQVMNERFAPQEFLFIGYEPKELPVLSQQTFTNLTTLSQRLQKLERVESVRSILNVPMISLMDDPMSADEISEFTVEKQDFDIADLKQAFKGHPIYEDLVINAPQTATALQVLFKPHDELNELQSRITEIQKNALERELTDQEQEQIEELRAQAEPLEQALTETRNAEIATIREMLVDYESDANMYMGGVHVLAYQLIDIIQNDLVVFGGIIAGVICLVLLFLFRRFRWVFLPVICCACSVTLTVGLFGMLGLKTTVISSNFVALQLILTLAIVIHLIVQYREYAALHPDWDQQELVRRSFLKKVKPCFYAGLTTSIGFGSLLLTGIQPVIAFGWMMIIAMFFSISVSLILFPALMTLFPRDKARDNPKMFQALLSGFTRTAQNRPRITVGISSLALAMGVGGLFLLDVENSFINYFSESTEVHQELSFIDQELGGSTPLDVIVTVPKPEGQHSELLATAETVQQLQRIQELLDKQKGMGKVLSIVNFTKLAKEVNEGRPLTEYELTAVYRVVSDDLREDLIGSFFSEEHSQVRISARVQDATEGLNRAELLENIKSGIEEIGLAEDDYQLTSLFVLYQDILQQLFRSQILALGLVYLVLTITFCILFRSIKVGLVGIAPNILSTISVLGIMGWAGIPLDLMTITIASIAMGIAVDDTIHYTHRYLDEVKDVEGAKALEATNYSVGYAVLYTSLIIIMGFSLLVFSEFVPSVNFGLLSSLAMAMALIWNLTLLPVLLKKFIPGSQE